MFTQSPEYTLPPHHSVPEGTDGDAPYITCVRRKLGIADDDQGEKVIGILRAHWNALNQTGTMSDRATTLEVYYGERLGYDEVVALGVTALWLGSGGDFDKFIDTAYCGYPHLGTYRAAMNPATTDNL